MLEVSNSTAQTLAPGQSLTFDRVVLRSKCGSESLRSGTPLVRIGSGKYDVAYFANVASATAGTPVQLSIQFDGATLTETTAISTPSTANVFNNIGRSTFVATECCNCNRSTVTVINTGTAPITVGANSVLKIHRVA